MTSPGDSAPFPFPEALARRIGLASVADYSADTMLGWAIHWAERGLKLFPCRSFLGTPIPAKWYRAATDDVSQLVEWWIENPDADIAAVPDQSGHFVLSAIGRVGLRGLAELVATHGPLTPEFETDGNGARHLWFKGRAMTSRWRLGPGLNVCGPGTFVYLPPSLAPDPE